MSSSSAREIKSVTTSELYDRWASVYDTDGNILQAVDDSLFPSLLNRAVSLLSTSSPITITELGCGTGRNTVKLLSPSLPEIKDINALDLSPAMLSLAKARCTPLLTSNPLPAPTLSFHEFDALNANILLKTQLLGKANLVISTLVLEHLPLDIFFGTTASLLSRTTASPGYLILTNMHHDLGSRSRAGFTDPISGIKTQGESFAYTVSEVLEAAGGNGFRLEGEVVERSVNEEDVGDEAEGTLLGPRGRKWIGVGVWFGMVFGFGGLSS